MNYEIKFHKTSIKGLKKLDKQTRNRILDQLVLLSENPYNQNLSVKKMQGLDDTYRLRVGFYRVVFSIIKVELIIFVIKVGPRGDMYK